MDYGLIFLTLSPEFVLAVAAMAVMGLDLTVLKGTSRIYRMTAAAGVMAIGIFTAILLLQYYVKDASFPLGMLVQNPLNLLVKKVILFVALTIGLLATEVRFTRNVGEYYALLMLATIGMMLLVSTENLLLLFVALELTSLSLYVLAGYNERSRESAEAGMKYFLFGGMSAAFLLFGFSYLYGLGGTLDLGSLGLALSAHAADPLLSVALILVVIGFGFKLAAVPFHFWAPDTYQGAPIASTMLIGSASKVAGGYAFLKLLLIGFGAGGWSGSGETITGWAPLLALIAVLSMVFGNLAALAQTSVRRLLGYSAVAHAGYLLLGFFGSESDAYHSVVFYLTVYALTTVGAFGVIAAVQGKGRDLTLRDFAGFSRKSPEMALCLLVFILSLAGIPPLAGFAGKFYLFAAALKSDPGHMGMLAAVSIGVVMSAVSLYYYLQLLKQVFVADPIGPVLRVKAGFLGRSMILLLAFCVITLGCAPGIFLDLITGAVISVSR
ncbi:MAG: NADH-quinone oxidoreductase subunit N [Verrucomicrobiae bacterium]|nr:NADH-quinone oxidoreductase subunit N [Verrucomicrobiae bacterium]